MKIQISKTVDGVLYSTDYALCIADNCSCRAYYDPLGWSEISLYWVEPDVYFLVRSMVTGGSMGTLTVLNEDRAVAYFDALLDQYVPFETAFSRRVVLKD